MAVTSKLCHISILYFNMKFISFFSLYVIFIASSPLFSFILTRIVAINRCKQQCTCLYWNLYFTIFFSFTIFVSWFEMSCVMKVIDLGVFNCYARDFMEEGVSVIPLKFRMDLETSDGRLSSSDVCYGLIFCNRSIKK